MTQSCFRARGRDHHHAREKCRRQRTSSEHVRFRCHGISLHVGHLPLRNTSWSLTHIHQLQLQPASPFRSLHPPSHHPVSPPNNHRPVLPHTPLAPNFRIDHRALSLSGSRGAMDDIHRRLQHRQEQQHECAGDREVGGAGSDVDCSGDPEEGREGCGSKAGGAGRIKIRVQGRMNRCDAGLAVRRVRGHLPHRGR